MWKVVVRARELAKRTVPATNSTGRLVAGRFCIHAVQDFTIRIGQDYGAQLTLSFSRRVTLSIAKFGQHYFFIARGI